ncbi:unnamed protein product [Ectocarpus sp. 8 AP-2014]
MACREFGLDTGSPNWVLKHKRAVVDLSQPFRFTGIPQNATLELTEEAPVRRKAAGSTSAGGQVRVAMRLPGGGRVQAPFSADTSLLGLLQWWAGRGELDAGVLQQGPSLQFMRTAYGAGDLDATTLRSIGLVTGSAMFTLSLSSPGAAGAAAAPLSSSSSSAAALPPPPGAGADAGSKASTRAKLCLCFFLQEEADLREAIARSAAEARPTTANAIGGGRASTTKAAVTPPASSPLSGMASKEAATSRAAPAAAGVSTAGAPPSPTAATATATAAATVAVTAGGEGGRQAGAGGSAQGEAGQADAMEVDQPSVPAMGIDVCRAALEAMAAGHFDADSEACVTTLAKVIDNVVHRPGDSRTRQIRCGNAAFQHKVGRITGGISFLEGVGFMSREDGPQQQQQLLGGGDGRGSAGDRFLVLPPKREDAGLLKAARDLLSKQAEALGVPRERMPQPPRARPSPPPPSAGQASAAAAAFDPYKPFMTSTAPTPKGPQESSLTEKRLQELLAKRAAVVSGGAPQDRNIQARRQTSWFELYVSPPRVVLKAASSLSDAGLVPAALVYASWREVPPTGEAEGGYLKRELVSGTTPGGAAAAAAAAASARPVGVALDGGAKGSEESKTGGGSAGGGSRLGGKTGGGSSGGKRTGKPSWLKIN